MLVSTLLYATALHYDYRFLFCLLVFHYFYLQLDLCYVLLFLCDIFVCHFIFSYINMHMKLFFLITIYYLVVPSIVHSYYIIFIDTVKHWVMVILK